MVATAGTARGAGFALFEQGAKATALGGAFTAQADDPSAMFFNPAGNAFIDTFTMQGGGFVILRPTAELNGLSPYPGDGYRTDMKKSLYWIGNGYGVLPLTSDLKLAAGFWTPYGLGVPWQDPDNFRGRFINQRVDLRMVSISAQLSYKLADWLAVGLGPEIRLSDVKLSRNVPLVNPFTQSVVDVAHVSLITQGTPWKMAWGAGIMAKPTERLSLGVAFHSHVDFDYTGTAYFTQIPSGSPQFDAAVAGRLPFGANGTPGATTLQFPSLLMFGISYDVTPKVKVNVDGNYTSWKVFDQTVLRITGVPNIVLQHDFVNTWTARAGLQFKASDSAWIGAGFVYDQSPQPDSDVSPFLPDSNRTGVSVGAGFKLGKMFTVDISSLFLWFHDRTTTTQNDNFSATYRIFAILPGISIKSSF
jgi:long-chain fatty acid transport protein